jgi:hypothetical protein
LPFFEPFLAQCTVWEAGAEDVECELGIGATAEDILIEVGGVGLGRGSDDEGDWFWKA